jgi:hypothetical protein
MKGRATIIKRGHGVDGEEVGGDDALGPARNNSVQAGPAVRPRSPSAGLGDGPGALVGAASD